MSNELAVITWFVCDENGMPIEEYDGVTIPSPNPFINLVALPDRKRNIGYEVKKSTQETKVPMSNEFDKFKKAVKVIISVPKKKIIKKPKVKKASCRSCKGRGYFMQSGMSFTCIDCHGTGTKKTKG